MRNAVVTGAAGGIGFALVERLLSEGWTVAASAHHPSEDLAALAGRSGDRLRIHVGDLADAATRRDLAGRIAAAEPRIDALFNVAGVSTATMEFSPQQHELHYEVNAIAPYVLMDALVAQLAAARGRIVNTVSDAIFFAKAYNPDKLARPERFRKVTGPYAGSKLALVLWSKAIAPRLAERGIGIVSVSPGPVRTGLMRGPGIPGWMRLLASFTAKPPSYAAGLLFDAASAPYDPGTLLMQDKKREPPFATEAARTLEVIQRAARY